MSTTIYTLCEVALNAFDEINPIFSARIRYNSVILNTRSNICNKNTLHNFTITRDKTSKIHIYSLPSLGHNAIDVLNE
jgi:hypothetical protein